MKYANKSFKEAQNAKGHIQFDFLEYNEHLASTSGVEFGRIAIKLADGTKLRSNLSKPSFAFGDVRISGFKNITKGIAGVEYKIKHGLYEWAETDIYNAIVNAQNPIEVVIQFGGSSYKFTMELPTKD